MTVARITKKITSYRYYLVFGKVRFNPGSQKYAKVPSISAVERIFSGFLEVDCNKKDKDGVKWGDLFKMTDTYRLRGYPLKLRKEMTNEA